MTTLKILILVAVLCTPSIVRANQSPDGTNFEYLLLAQFWPTTSCLYFENEGQECVVPPEVNGWTIHGLWPAIRNTEKPDYCNNSMKFDYNQIQSLSASLNTNWPYYNKAGPKTELWEHEWTKHGTCAFSLPYLQGEYKYFSHTLDLHSNLNTLKILAASGIVPSESNQYKPQDIFNAVRKGYGKIPDITCFYDKKEKQFHLEQIWLCFDKQLQQIDCPGVSLSKIKVDTLYFESMRGQDAEPMSFFEGCPMSGTIFYKPIPRT